MIEQEEDVKRSFQVDIDVIATHTFIVDDVNSQEEAEQVAEEWLDDGEDGTISNKEIFSTDSYPVQEDIV